MFSSSVSPLRKGKSERSKRRRFACRKYRRPPTDVRISQRSSRHWVSSKLPACSSKAARWSTGPHWPPVKSTKFFSTTRPGFLAKEQFPSLRARLCTERHSACGVSSCIASAKTSQSKATCAIPTQCLHRQSEKDSMFTGIIEEVGRVAKIEQHGENRRLTVEAANTPRQLATGDSVAVSGVCLTALDI